MKNLTALCLALGFAFNVAAQDITPDEMIQLDKMRTQMKSRGVEMTPEQEARMLQTMRALKGMTGQGLGQMLMSGQASAAAKVEQPPAMATISEDELAQKIAALAPVTSIASIEILRDGLQYDGKRFVDEQGRGENYAIDPTTGTIGYQVRSSPNLFTLKIARLNGSSPVEIGRIQKNGQSYSFESVTGKKLGGDLIFPLANGALVLREGVGFLYTAGKGVQQIQFPAGWLPAPLQRGNISATGWMLLERDRSDEKSNPIKSAMSSINRLGSMIASSDANDTGDYALFEIATNKIKMFDISSDSKKIGDYSNCRKVNDFYNKCESVTTYESLWDKDGSPNNGHYFWRINWQSVKAKTVAVVLENGVKRVNAYQLTDDKKINLFNRMLGISNLKFAVSSDKLKISAGLGFSTEIVDDVLAAFDKLSEVKAAN
jgi:hypothetical protein